MQASGRQKQAAGEVDAKRKEKEQMHSEADNEIDIPMNDETAQAATKIQAKFRRSVLSCFSFLWVAAVHASIRQAKASGR